MTNTLCPPWLTNAARIQLKVQGTQVIGVYAGYIGTEMATQINSANTGPADVAARTLEGVEAGIDHVLAGKRAHETWLARCADPAGLEAASQARWDQYQRSWAMKAPRVERHKYVCFCQDVRESCGS